jgi:hypothetical protein
MTPQRGMPAVPVRFDIFPLQGGLDLHTPQLSVAPGVARDAQNYECSINGGYTRIPGYERFDGRTSPSNATYGTIASTAVAGLAVGDSINGQTSGATGVVCAIDGLTVVYTKATGTFQVGENLREGGTVRGVITTVGIAVTDQVVAAGYKLAAAEIYRADIQAVPGSGAVRGVFVFNGMVYAFRNNAGGTAAVLHRAGVSGWSAVAMPSELSFTAGSGTAPAEGATITKGAVTAVVRRVMLQSGTFGAGTAAGRLIIDTIAGGNFSAGAFTGGITATCSGAQTAVSFLPGGRFEFAIGNVGYAVRVYGVDGVNRGFEFDGTYVCPISTGNEVDTPSHLAIHKKYLFYSFLSSVQFSGIATPYQWTILSGAGEIAMNQPVTGFISMPGDATTAALGIASNDQLSVLYGTSSANWNRVDLPGGMGAKPYSLQTLQQSYVYDDQGVTSISAAQSFGNFATSTLTTKLRSFVQARRTLVTDSLVNREKSQYRTFFSDGYGLYCTVVNGQFLGAMPVYFPNPVFVSCNGESTNGSEVSYFGSTNGFVYRMDIGTSFDGAPIEWFCELSFAAQGNARMLKRYRRVSLEMQGDGYVSFNLGYTLAYGSTDAGQESMAAAVSPVYWDQFTWDEFVWDGRAIAPSQLALTGTAENISLRTSGSSALWPEHTINSATIHYTPRRALHGQ